jgi:hypothetical protein
LSFGFELRCIAGFFCSFYVVCDLQGFHYWDSSTIHSSCI